jgi:hypothetical protein
MVPLGTINFTNAVVFNFGFSSIPQTYQDLMMVFNGTMNTSSGLVIDDINLGSPVCNYTALSGNGTTLTSERGTQNNGSLFVTPSVGNLVAGLNSFIIHMPNYTGSTFKTVLSRRASDNNGSGIASIQVGTIQTTSAITYFKFSSQNTNNFFTSGTATLYGIKAGA